MQARRLLHAAGQWGEAHLLGAPLVLPSNSAASSVGILMWLASNNRCDGRKLCCSVCNHRVSLHLQYITKTAAHIDPTALRPCFVLCKHISTAKRSDDTYILCCQEQVTHHVNCSGAKTTIFAAQESMLSWPMPWGIAKTGQRSCLTII